jgi:hypothetical protein
LNRAYAFWWGGPEVGARAYAFQRGSEDLDVLGDRVDVEYNFTARVSFGTQQLAFLPLS